MSFRDGHYGNLSLFKLTMFLTETHTPMLPFAPMQEYAKIHSSSPRKNSLPQAHALFGIFWQSQSFGKFPPKVQQIKAHHN